MSPFSILVMSTSYIADLPPENITYQLTTPVETKVRKEPIQAPAYAPLDVHKNPYLAEGPGSSGIPNPNALSQSGPPPQYPQAPQQQPFQGGPPPQYAQGPQPPMPQITSMKPQPPNRLPSRDIPQSTLGLMQDETVLPNYVPTKKLTRDFVKDEEDLSEERITKRKQLKQQARTREEWIRELQVPVLIAVLYYVFQLPFAQDLFQRLLPYLPILFSEGVPNVYGLIAKAILFGAAFYFLSKTTDLANPL
jgi:hypothetical protein